LTKDGLRIPLFFTRTYARLLRPSLTEILANASPSGSPLRTAFDQLLTLIDQACKEAKFAA
jgi:hypothetical protein